MKISIKTNHQRIAFVLGPISLSNSYYHCSHRYHNWAYAYANYWPSNGRLSYTKKLWYVNGSVHNTYGPARVCSNYDKCLTAQYYVNGSSLAPATRLGSLAAP